MKKVKVSYSSLRRESLSLGMRSWVQVQFFQFKLPFKTMIIKRAVITHSKVVQILHISILTMNKWIRMSHHKIWIYTSHKVKTIMQKYRLKTITLNNKWFIIILTSLLKIKNTFNNSINVILPLKTRMKMKINIKKKVN